jgi:pyridoxal 5'-phosphate synthase pdxS subunit
MTETYNKNSKFGTRTIKEGFAKMQKGGVIMDVTSVKQAKIAEESGAVAVMALERVPADIRAKGGVARMADPLIIQKIMDAVSIPVMAKVRIGHFVEAKALEAIGVDMIDESEVLTPADPFYHIDKKEFTTPFVCGCRNLGEAVRRIFEGAAMIRTKGEAGTGNIVEAIRHQRTVSAMIHALKDMNKAALTALAKKYAESYVKAFESCTEQSVKDNTILFAKAAYKEIKQNLYKILVDIRDRGRLPVVNFAAGGIATPADAAIMIQLGGDGVFVGSGIFKSSNPTRLAKAIVLATQNYREPKIIAEISKDLGDPMPSIAIEKLSKQELLGERGW